MCEEPHSQWRREASSSSTSNEDKDNHEKEEEIARLTFQLATVSNDLFRLRNKDLGAIPLVLTNTDTNNSINDNVEGDRGKENVSLLGKRDLGGKRVQQPASSKAKSASNAVCPTNCSHFQDIKSISRYCQFTY